MRYVRLHCQFPGQAQSVRLFGSITFFKYLGENSSPACEVGVMFGQMEEHEIAAYRDYYSHIERMQNF